MVDYDECLTCEYIEQPDACQGCNEATEHGSWQPAKILTDHFGDDSKLYTDLNWSFYGCFGSYDEFNPACDIDDCSLSEPCKKRREQ
jgi:hypothetical protein